MVPTGVEAFSSCNRSIKVNLERLKRIGRSEISRGLKE